MNLEINNKRFCKVSYEKQLPSAEVIQVVDFFCGCGGMSYGFKTTRQSHLRYEIVCGIDIDPVALQTYERMVGATGINADIFEYAENLEILRDVLVNHGYNSTEPTVFIGCAPCQGFSSHRKKDLKHNIDDTRNSLPVAFADICVEFKPDYIVMENVPEVFTGKYKHYMENALKILTQAGYQLTKDIVDLSHYGVPQKRRRAIIIGCKVGRAVSLPLPVFDDQTNVTVRDAISHLDNLDSGQVCKYDPWHKAPNHTERILNLIEHIPVDGGDRRTLSKDEQLICHRKLDNGDTPGFTDVYGRLYWDKPSVSITAKCSTPSCGRFLHPEQNRNITVREAALLQGFPPSFEFSGPFANQYRQIGEAVPPLFARFVAWGILDHYRPITPTHVFEKKQCQKKSKKGFTVIEAFCGAGGLTIGLLNAGLNVKLAFDIDDYSLETQRFNLGVNAEKVDITQTTSEELFKIAGLKYELDVFVGGPPCQGFSQQRRGSNDDKRNNLVTVFGELAVQLNPKAVIMENVTYLDSPRGHDILLSVLELWKQNGYNIFRHDLNSADFGVPQLRNRIVIVAIKNEYSWAYEGPVSTHSNRWLTIGEVLQGLEEPGDDEKHKTINHCAANESLINKRRIAFVGMGEGRLAIPDYLQLQCHKKYDGHLDVYGRLDWFGLARTITGGFDSFTRGEYAHPFRHRSITHREAALIQGFPDWFIFKGNKAAARRQIGNAVPPPLGSAVAKAVVKALKTAEEQMNNKKVI